MVHEIRMHLGEVCKMDLGDGFCDIEGLEMIVHNSRSVLLL
jgi:hypothetical protein